MASKQESQMTSTSSDPSYMDDAARHRMIAEAAYFKAESRGFCGDRALDDWLDAECEINACCDSASSKPN